jgi:hypothetical protein
MTKDGYPLWDMSDASKLWKEDINNGLRKNITPHDFWNSQAEYKIFLKNNSESMFNRRHQAL